MTTAIVNTEDAGAAGDLRVHADPDINAAVVGAFTHGETVEVTGLAQNGFLPVSAGGIVGWASVDYLKTQGLNPLLIAGIAGGGVLILLGLVAVAKKKKRAAARAA